jgi:hypothetical protein
MTLIQRISAPDAVHADQDGLSPPDWHAALPRLEALQRLRLKILPTARVVRSAYMTA